MAIVEGIAAAKAAFDVSKVALDLTRHPKLDIHTIQDRLLELQGLILNAQRSLGDAEEEIRTLKRALDDREAFKVLEDDMEFQIDGSFWVRRSEKARGLRIPYCPVCWGNSHKLMPLTPKVSTVMGGYRCPSDGQSFDTQAYHEGIRRENEQAYGSLPEGPDAWMAR